MKNRDNNGTIEEINKIKIFESVRQLRSDILWCPYQKKSKVSEVCHSSLKDGETEAQESLHTLTHRLSATFLHSPQSRPGLSQCKLASGSSCDAGSGTPKCQKHQCVCLLHPSDSKWQVLKEKKAMFQHKCAQPAQAAMLPGALSPLGSLGAGAAGFWMAHSALSLPYFVFCGCPKSCFLSVPTWYFLSQHTDRTNTGLSFPWHPLDI